MNQDRDGSSANSAIPWFHRPAAAFAIGLVSGGICIPLVQFLVFGNADPFTHGWPLWLEASAFLITLIFTLRGHCPTVLTLGLYAGLVGVMLVAGESEYTVASAIALAVHGFVPAACGSALGWLVLSGMRSQIAQASAASKAVNRNGPPCKF
jgi:hypothetical protein